MGPGARTPKWFIPIGLRACPPESSAGDVCDDGTVNLRAVGPLGTFHARLTRDGAAHGRDGQPFVLLNSLATRDPDIRLVEIMFEDGEWMLARQEDLEMNTDPRTDAAN